MRSTAKWAALVALVISALALNACELNESCDPTLDPGCIPVDPDAGDATLDGADGAGELMTYHYALILDQEPPTTGGVDLDAVSLIQKGGRTHYASDFHECIFGPGIENVETTRDCNQALGPPNNAAGECTADDTFYVNLGGLGGSIVVSFGDLEEIQEGDVIRVYECGRRDDYYSVRVGVGTSVSDPNFIECVSRASGVSECTVPALPQIPIN